VTSTHAVRFAAVGLDHAHIFGQVAGLIEAGAEFVGMATDDPSVAIAARLRERYPDVPLAESPDELINSDGIDLIVTAAVPDRRGQIAVAALRSGKPASADATSCAWCTVTEETSKHSRPSQRAPARSKRGSSTTSSTSASASSRPTCSSSSAAFHAIDGCPVFKAR